MSDVLDRPPLPHDVVAPRDRRAVAGDRRVVRRDDALGHARALSPALLSYVTLEKADVTLIRREGDRVRLERAQFIRIPQGGR